MKKINPVYIVLILVLLVIIYFFNANSNNKEKQVVTSTPQSTAINQPEAGKDPLNTTYIIEGKEVTLVNGKAEQEIPNSSSSVITENFNQPTYGDLTGDGLEDAAFMLTQSTGGSGTFFYTVASVNSGEGFKGTNAILLGDRISPQGVDISDLTVIANYAEVAGGDPLSAQPSVGVSKYMKVEGYDLVETTPDVN